MKENCVGLEVAMFLFHTPQPFSVFLTHVPETAALITRQCLIEDYKVFPGWIKVI